MDHNLLPRELLRWIHGLNLQVRVRNPKWDSVNGFLVAEILYSYFPTDVDLVRFYDKGESLDLRMRNWGLIKQFFIKKKIPISDSLSDATMHAKDGAAVLLLSQLFEVLTNRKLRHPQPSPPLDFSDTAYQNVLPLHARGNTVSAVRSNLRLTEFLSTKNENMQRDMVARIIGRQLADRYDHRETEPQRFGILPSIGQKCPRREPRPGEALLKSGAQSANPSGDRMSSLYTEPPQMI